VDIPKTYHYIPLKFHECKRSRYQDSLHLYVMLEARSLAHPSEFVDKRSFQDRDRSLRLPVVSDG